MEGCDYRYLFPFEKISYGSKVIIYGAGVLGCDYLRQLLITGYCKIVGLIDVNYDKYRELVLPTFSPNKIKELEFDYVVIALRAHQSVPEITRVLKEYGVKDNQIVFVGERDGVEIHKANNIQNRDKCNIEYAYNNSSLSGAFYMNGGFGDAIICKRFVDEIISLLPGCKIDIFHPKASKFLHSLFFNNSNINALIDDSGIDYSEKKEEYKFSFTLGHYFPQIDNYDELYIKNRYPVFYNKINRLKNRDTDAENSFNIPYIVRFLRNIYKGYDCYTGFSCDGIFEIHDNHVDIPFDVNYKSQYKELKLNQYITINYGNGDSRDISLVAKAWPLYRFSQFVRLFKKEYPAIKVIQLGDKGVDLIEGTDYQIMGKSLELVKYVLKGALLHIDIEGGLVHLASQLGTKCAVLFGPTDVRYYGYRNNINISVGNCHNCCYLYNQGNRCARDMKEPECMYSITPEIVMEHVDDYMKSL